MNFQDSVKSGLTNYANFQGRASRSEFWWFALFCAIIGLVAGVTDAALFGVTDPQETGPAGVVANLALLIPSLSIGARRLHDVDRSGWWQLIMLTIIGIALLIYWFIKPGDEGINTFGAPNPQTLRGGRVVL
jgi:uncharacterized membrane protein YhaH (DUF805 family)